MRGLLRRRAATLPSRRRLASPAVRRAARWAFPFVAAAGLYAGVMLTGLPAGRSVVAAITDRAVAASARLGLVVDDIEVEGRETTDAATILKALGAGRGTPIFAVSPSRARAQLESLPWVRSAAIERHLPGTLRVRLVERRPLAVWQHGGRQELIDREGAVIPVKDLSRFAKVPTVVGEDAARHAAALIDMLASEPQLAARVTAAVRVDGRRWNLRIDHAIDVLLPEEDAKAAWARLGALERQNQLLQRDLQTVDLRLPDRVVLRATAPPPAPSSHSTRAKKTHLAGGGRT
ncbi:MAG: cell division protein FtsQ/DivIB [Thiohalocapsa sp.]